MVYSYIVADKETHNLPIRTYKGKELIPIAKQYSKRTVNQKPTLEIFLLEGTQILYQKYGAAFVPLYRHEFKMRKAYETFVQEPLTEIESAWLNRNGYVLL